MPPTNLQATRLPSNSRLPAVNIQAVCTILLSKGRTAVFPSISAESLFASATNSVAPITVLVSALRACLARVGSDQGQTGVRPGSDRGQTGVRPGSDRGQTRVRPGSDRGHSRV